MTTETNAARQIAGPAGWIGMDKPDEFKRIMDRFLERVGGLS